jgi:hypothetical protein
MGKKWCGIAVFYAKFSDLAGELVALLARLADTIVAHICGAPNLVNVSLDAAKSTVAAVQSDRPTIALAWSAVIAGPLEDLVKKAEQEDD